MVTFITTKSIGIKYTHYCMPNAPLHVGLSIYATCTFLRMYSKHLRRLNDYIYNYKVSNCP